MTAKYIVVYGRNSDIVYADDIEAAGEKAKAFARADGLSPEEVEDPDIVRAHTYDFWRARDMNLIWRDERDRDWITKEVRT